MHALFLTIAQAPLTLRGSSIGDAGLRLGVAMAGLVAVLGLVTLVLPKLVAKARGGLGAAPRSTSLSVEATVRVGPQASLVLVTCGVRRLLVGVSNAGTSLIASIDEADTEPAMPASVAVEPSMPAASHDAWPRPEPTADFLALLGTARRQASSAHGARTPKAAEVPS